MARLVILGAGIAGHTAALVARRKLSKSHEVTVISPKEVYNWIPSNIWVGVGAMPVDEVVFPLKPVYDRQRIKFVNARATEIYPEGSAKQADPHVVTDKGDIVPYDYLINATGPKLNFAATPGIGPEAFTQSVCTNDHADKAGKAFLAAVDKMKKGEKQTLVIGMGHGLCTCEGAAFEYIFNIEFELRKHGVRDKARIIYLTNEHELGDFGVGGLHVKTGGFTVHSKTFAESLFAERGVEWITSAHVNKVEQGKVFYETLDGTTGELAFDFAMLIPPFSGVGIKAFDKSGKDITLEVFAASGFMKVDADYTAKKYDDWKASDWPKTYRNPKYENIYAVGIAFAPPHQISMPRMSTKGVSITPSPPRTGMPSAIMGRAVALNVADLINGNKKSANRTASMSELGAACVASAGAHWWWGTAASMTMYPIVPDFEKYPDYGRDVNYTFSDIGLAGHWIKRILHHMFLYKAKAYPLWWIIPE